MSDTSYSKEGVTSKDGLNNYSVRRHVEDLVDAAKERKKKPSKDVLDRADRVVDLMFEVKRKGALQDKKKYERIREAFEQNYRKLHPN